MFKIYREFILALIAFFFTSIAVLAQSNELGFHLSPAKLAPTQFDRDTSIARGKSPFGASRQEGGVYMNGFNSITNSLALKVQYSYNLRKSTRPVPAVDGKIRQAVFLEAFGSGGLYSVNYDRRFKTGNHGLGARAGVGGGWLYSTEETEGARYVSFPILLNYIAGKGRSGFEAGIGLTTNLAPTKPVGDPRLLTFGVGNIGYRLQPLKNGFMMRATWTPVFDKEGFYPKWAGLSVGYSFK